MLTNELENKLKITKNAGIYCPTLKLAKQVLNIFNDLGLKWCSGIYYTKCTDWDMYKENTIYYPFEGRFSSLTHAQQINCKIISAEEFIILHTKKKNFNLENYIPEGQLEGFPKEIIKRMLDCQEEQGNKRDVDVFEERILSPVDRKGFSWYFAKEKFDFWDEVIRNKNFDVFFEKYPKQDNQYNSQEFRVGDKVYDIILGKVGIVKEIIINNLSVVLIEVVFENYGTVRYYLEGKFLSIDKYPRLLHYRDDYNYDVIDFNNLPKRQEPKRWRAEEGEYYYYFIRHEYDFNLDKIYKSLDYYNQFSNDQYKIGNYFQTKEEAQEVADKLKEFLNN